MRLTKYIIGAPYYLIKEGVEIITKRIVIELYGLIRTHRVTFDKFFFNVIKAKYQYNYIVDIFIHT